MRRPVTTLSLFLLALGCNGEDTDTRVQTDPFVEGTLTLRGRRSPS